jgi:hypothetical protein
MSSLKSFRPTAPMVINLIALFIVLGGQAIALSGKHRIRRGDLAPGAVTGRTLALRAVSTNKLAAHSVSGAALGGGAVTGRAINPGVIRGRSLAGTFQIPATVSDLDAIAGLNWTTSGATATCPSAAKLLGGGVVIQNVTTNGAVVQSTYPSSSNASTWVGEISTDTGGASPALLYAHCLR